MGKIPIKELKKKGLIAPPISLAKFLEYDLKNPDDVMEFQKFKLLYRLHEFMLKQDISKAELARKLNISRQAVTNKFLGETLTIDWIVRAFAALGIKINLSMPSNRPDAANTSL